MRVEERLMPVAKSSFAGTLQIVQLSRDAAEFGHRSYAAVEKRIRYDMTL